MSLLLLPENHRTTFKPHMRNAPQQLVIVSWAHLLSFVNNSSYLLPLQLLQNSSSIKEFLEKGGDFNQDLSQFPQLAHTHCFKSPAIGSGRSQPHVCKLNLGSLSKKSTHIIGNKFFIVRIQYCSQKTEAYGFSDLEVLFLSKGQRLKMISPLKA